MVLGRSGQNEGFQKNIIPHQSMNHNFLVNEKAEIAKTANPIQQHNEIQLGPLKI